MTYKKTQTKKYAKRRVTRKPAYKSIKAVVQSVLNTQEEVKQQVSTWASAPSPSNRVARNNTMYTFAPQQNITVGNTDYTRVGNQIYLKHVLAKMTLDTNLPNLKIRMMGVWIDNATLVAGDGMQVIGGVGASQMFHPTSVSLCDALLNNKLGNNVVMDKKFTILNPNPNSFLFRNFKIDCKINKKVQYNAGSQLFNDKQFFIIIIVSAPQIAPGVDWSTPNNVRIGIDAISTYKDA